MDLSPALRKIFPLTFSLLTDAETLSLQNIFSREWGLDQIHFFPMLIRQQKFTARIVETADYEYLKHWLGGQSVTRVNSPAPFVLNPTLQFIWIDEAAFALSKDPGLYALWKWDEKEFERKILPEEAKVLDRLRDDQIFLSSEFTEGQNEVLTRLISAKLVIETVS